MFKEYCHTSSQTQCYIILLTLKPYYSKKKRVIQFKPRARAKKQEYRFCFAQSILPFITYLALIRTLFILLYPELMLHIIFILIRYTLAPTLRSTQATSRSLHYSFLLLACGSNNSAPPQTIK
jgi:hypothetical protein